MLWKSGLHIIHRSRYFVSLFQIEIWNNRSSKTKTKLPSWCMKTTHGGRCASARVCSLPPVACARPSFEPKPPLPCLQLDACAAVNSDGTHSACRRMCLATAVAPTAVALLVLTAADHAYIKLMGHGMRGRCKIANAVNHTAGTRCCLPLPADTGQYRRFWQI